MPYEARVKQTATIKNVRFAGDFEFVRYEWRPLPEEKLELARNNPYLEIKSADAGQNKTPAEVMGSVWEVLEDEPTAVEEVIPKKRPRTSRTRKAKK